jgi:uncharacterized integral membrane protein
MKHVRAFFIILVMLFVVILAVQNYEAMSTDVRFRLDLGFHQWESLPISVYFVVVIAFLTGIIIAGLYGITERFRLKRKIKTLQNEAREKDKELASLRNLPVTTEAVRGLPENYSEVHS